MADEKKQSKVILTLGVSLVLTAVATYFLLNRSEAIPQREVSELFPFQDAESGLWGYINPDAKVVIEPRFDHADLFHGLGMVEYEGMAGYIDQTGDWAIAAKYMLAPDFSRDVAARPFWNGLAAVRSKGAWGFVDPEGNWAILPRFEGTDGFEVLGDFHNGLAWYKDQNGRYGYIDKTGEVAIEPTYHATNDFGEGYAGVLIKKEWGVIDSRGRLRIRPDFDGIGVFNEGLCAAKDNAGSFLGMGGEEGAWGYIDTKGDWIIPARFAKAGEFGEGLAPAHDGSAWGYIDHRGVYVLKPKYEDAWPFENGLARVTVDGKQQYIDETGRVVWPKPHRASSMQ